MVAPIMRRASFLSTPPKLTGEIRRFCATLAATARVFAHEKARGRVPAAGFPRRFEVAR